MSEAYTKSCAFHCADTVKMQKQICVYTRLLVFGRICMYMHVYVCIYADAAQLLLQLTCCHIGKSWYGVTML